MEEEKQRQALQEGLSQVMFLEVGSCRRHCMRSAFGRNRLESAPGGIGVRLQAAKECEMLKAQAPVDLQNAIEEEHKRAQLQERSTQGCRDSCRATVPLV